MKKLVFLLLLVAADMTITSPTHAQLSVSINIGNQPAWAPEGYDDAQYYYIPDMDIYYDVPAHQFVYLSNSRWIRSATLPAAYRKYDLYKVHKVVVNGKDAYRNHDRDKQQYANFRGKYDQHPIRDSRDEKYNSNKSNWQNNRFSNNGHNRQSKHDNGHNGHDDHHH